MQLLLLNKLSIADRYSQKYDAGTSHLDAALKLCAKYNLEMGETYVNYSAILMDLKKFKEAETFASRAIRAISADILVSNKNQDNKLSAIAYFNCGKCHQHLGNMREAMVNFQASLGILKKSGMSPDETMYKRITFEHLNCMKALNSHKAETNYTTAPKKTFFSVKNSKDKKPNEMEQTQNKSIFKTIGYVQSPEVNKPELKIKDRSAFSASAVRIRKSQTRKASSTSSNTGHKDEWDEANFKFRIRNTHSGNSHRSSTWKQKEEQSSGYCGTPSEGQTKKAPNESWDEEAKDVVFLKNKPTPPLVKNFTIESAIDRNKETLLRDLQQLNKIIIRPDKKMNTLHNRNNSGSKTSQLSSQSSAINERNTANSEPNMELIHSRNSSTGFFIKQFDHSTKKISTEKGKKDLLKSEFISDPNKESTSAVAVTPQRNVEIKTTSTTQRSLLVSSQAGENKSKKKLPSRPLQEYAAKKIQHGWKSTIYSDGTLKKRVQKEQRGARFLCNQYVLIWVSQSDKNLIRKHPCKIQVYLHKDSYLLSIFPLPSMNNRTLKIPKNINILDRDYSRIRLSNDLQPYLLPELEQPPIIVADPHPVLHVEAKPAVLPENSNPKSNLHDSLEKIKEEILNGLLEEDNEPSRHEEKEQTFLLKTSKVHSTPVMGQVQPEPLTLGKKPRQPIKVKREGADNKFKTAERFYQTKQNDRKPELVDDSPTNRIVDEIKFNKEEQNTESKSKETKAIHPEEKLTPPHPIQATSTTYMPVKVKDGTRYPVTKRYGDLNKQTSEEVKKTQRAAGLYLKDYLKSKKEIKLKHDQEGVLASKKRKFGNDEYLFTVFMSKSDNTIQVVTSSLIKKEKDSSLKLTAEDTNLWQKNPDELIQKLVVVEGKVQWAIEEEEVPMLSEEDEHRTRHNHEDLDPMLEVSEDMKDLKKGPSLNVDLHENDTLHKLEDDQIEEPAVEIPKSQKGRKEFEFEFRGGEGRNCTVIVKVLEDKKRIAEYFAPSGEYLGHDSVDNMTKDWIVRLLVWSRETTKPSVARRGSLEETSKPQFWAAASEQGIF